MSWCWGKGTSVICWRITRATTTGCARTLRSTRMLRSIDLRRQSGLSHQSLGSAVSIGTTFGWHNRYTQVVASALLFGLTSFGWDSPESSADAGTKTRVAQAEEKQEEPGFREV